MENTKMKPFNVVGITVKTTNENMQAATDIPALWNKWMTERMIDQIPNKVSSNIFCIYTDYEGDHSQPYLTVLGCEVENLNHIPEGMVGKSFDGGNYTKFTSRGDLTKGHVYNEWLKVWEHDLKRTYTADFECYGEKAQDPSNAEVDIFIAVE